MLDSHVDLRHDCFRGAKLRQGNNTRPLEFTTGGFDNLVLARHGTHLASVIFGQPGSSVHGIAPGASGILFPIYSMQESIEGLRPSCSQLDLARMIIQALAEKVHVINISGGEFTPTNKAHPLLVDAIQQCERSDVLIVSAAGNQGCDCLNIPAAMNSVLAVGATDWEGEPLELNNYGREYQSHGIVAPGKDLLGALPGGGTWTMTGTSAATAWVSGVVALLLSLQIKRGQKPSPRRVRQALLDSAIDCSKLRAKDCKRLFVGRINIPGAISLLFQDPIMTNTRETELTPSADMPLGDSASVGADCEFNPPGSRTSLSISPSNTPSAGLQPSAVEAQACGCGGNKSNQIVYVLGQVGYDLVSEARMDAFAQKMAAGTHSAPVRSAPQNQATMLDRLKAHPYEAASLEWTLSLDGTPVYAIRPQGPYAAEAYAVLREFLASHLNHEAERVSIPGVLAGNARLMSGQIVPVIVPELRGMYSWNTNALIDHQLNDDLKGGIHHFLERIYYGLRNLGVLPQDRAINFAATNAFNIEKIVADSLKEKLEHESIVVNPSPFSRPGSECWDVEIYFFYPDRVVQSVRKVYRFTVDVSDVVPVTVGPTRSWFTR